MNKEKLYYPIALDIKNRVVKVIGGGRVAQRKVKILLSFGPKIKIISPNLTIDLKNLVRKKKITYLKRIYKKGDLKDAFLVIAATSDNKVNRDVYKEALKKKILINVVDNSKLSNFISPAVLEKKGLMITVSSHGKNPKLAKITRDKIKDFLKWN
ncbi:MAG: bifunctional precorrin-2 dehydrogenase/sirohydrochlorin ferrochelatase [Candidatus Omnitrophota bacterium]